MRLFVIDRIAILNDVFPKSSGFVELRIMKGIRKKIDFTSDQITELNMKDSVEIVSGRPQTRIVWDITKDQGIEVDFSEKELDFLKSQISRLDSEKKISEAQFDLFEKIIG